MKRASLTNDAETTVGSTAAVTRGSLKIFFSYAPGSGATTAMLGEAQGLASTGRDVYVADIALPNGTKGTPFELDKVLVHRPDVVVLENLALPNPPGSRNLTRFQDVEELLRGGIDVYATMRVGDLQNERSRIAAMGGEVPAESVPDRIFYGAEHIEFVDIDPDELVATRPPAGKDTQSHLRLLRELRSIALRCVSDYVASASLQSDDGADVPVHDRVVALVDPDEDAGDVLLEASRLASYLHAPFEAVSIKPMRRMGGSVGAEAQARARAKLREQVEGIGAQLVEINSYSDGADALRDYLRTRGASDLVMVRKRVSFARRLIGPLLPLFDERVVEGLDGMQLHLVTQSRPGSLRSSLEQASSLLADFKTSDLVFALVIPWIAFALARGLSSLGFADAQTYLVLALGVAAVAAYTRSFLPGIVAVVLSYCIQMFFFVRPYNSFTVDHRATAMVLALFLVVLLALAFVVVWSGRSAMRARRKEQHTQALFDLNRSFLYAHSQTEVVNLALGSLTRLFGRSAVLYVYDPFDRARAEDRDARNSTAQTVSGDLDAATMGSLLQQSVVHWVFQNGLEAGNGTDTHGECDIYYLPLSYQGEVVGVVGLSTAARPLTVDDRVFFDLVAGQVTAAVERQRLAAKHLDDLSLMHVADVRASFTLSLITSMGVSEELTRNASDIMYSLSSEEAAYRDALQRFLLDEAVRSRIVPQRLRKVLENSRADTGCDVCAQIQAAVDETNNGLSGKLVSFLCRPYEGEDDETQIQEYETPVLQARADADLVRAAVRLVLEASLCYVDKEGKVEVEVRNRPDHVAVLVSDDRSSFFKTSAFDTAANADGYVALSYDTSRSKALGEVIRDRGLMSGDPQVCLEAMRVAMHVPAEMVHEESGNSINRQRLLRCDRIEYGLYMAALIVWAHGGTIKQRVRLGGGSVVSFTLPKD